MNKIINKFSLAGNKLMPEMHGKQVFTYSTYHKTFDIAKNPKYDGCQCGIV